MKVVIWNGNPDAGKTSFDESVDRLARSLNGPGNEVRILPLRDLHIDGCRGCWDCWVKTPGECSHPDDTGLVRRETISADLLIFASPLELGFVSWILKRTLEKMIPLIHPYMEFVDGEVHHMARYERYPKMALYVEAAPEDSKEDLQRLEENFRRVAINFKTKLIGLTNTSDRMEEVSHELAGV